jgi:selenide,water dikinase
VDFFTPIVDDAYDFGRIAAANALSDIYAMGATAVCALNIVAFPLETFGPQVLARILAGGADIAASAGVAIVGGHTIKDDEPKYGLAVTGIVHPKNIITNAGARTGDALVLTKPLGTGILSSALKNDAIGETEMAEAIAWMTTLNDGASRAMVAAGAHAATDVTGFGLLGHANEIAAASGVALRIEASRVPRYTLALDMVTKGIAPGGTRCNVAEHAEFTTFASGIPNEERLLLSDAQTSGGLLIAVAPENVDGLCVDLRNSGVLAAVIGSVQRGSGIVVEP